MQFSGLNALGFQMFTSQSLMLFYQDEFWKAFLLSSAAHVCDALPLASDSEHTSVNSTQLTSGMSYVSPLLDSSHLNFGRER